MYNLNPETWAENTGGYLLSEGETNMPTGSHTGRRSWEDHMRDQEQGLREFRHFTPENPSKTMIRYNYEGSD